MEFFSYSPEEEKEIVASIVDSRKELPENEMHFLASTIGEIFINNIKFKWFCDSIDSRIAFQENLLVSLRTIFLKYALDYGNFEVNAYQLRDPHYVKARPYLAQMYIHEHNELKKMIRSRDFSEEERRNTPPRLNWVRYRLLEVAAEYWESYGDVVNMGREYRRFFEAVVKPPWISKQGREAKLGDWPDATYPERNEIFRRHAREWMAQRKLNEAEYSPEGVV